MKQNTWERLPVHIDEHYNQFCNVDQSEVLVCIWLSDVFHLVTQDLREKPKYLLTFTVGIKQKEYVDECVKKVCSMNLLPSFHFVSNLFKL